MNWFEWLDWLEHWTSALAISAWDWLIRTIQFAADWYHKAWILFYSWWGVVEFYVLGFMQLAQRAINWWLEKIHNLFEHWWTRIQQFFEDWWGRATTLYADWWSKLTELLIQWWDRLWQLLDSWWTRYLKVFGDWWELITKWFEDWCVFFVDLFEEHREKIVYCLTEGWPKVWWFVHDRFELIFQDFENNIEGWGMFVSDPAQAIWDWVEPRIEELTADFLSRVW